MINLVIYLGIHFAGVQAVRGMPVTGGECSRFREGRVDILMDLNAKWAQEVPSLANSWAKGLD